MSFVVSFDSETTTIPDWKAPSEGPDQPHLVSLAALLFAPLTEQITDQMDVIIKPDGWVSSQEAFEVHGITTEHALAVGIPEADALWQLHEMCLRAGLRTAFNTTFDNRMVRIAQKRYWPQEDPYYVEQMRSWKEDKDRYCCTMINTKKHFGLSKNPTLEAAYQMFFNKPLRTPGQAHNGMQDATACMEIFLELRRRGAPI